MLRKNLLVNLTKKPYISNFTMHTNVTFSIISKTSLFLNTKLTKLILRDLVLRKLITNHFINCLFYFLLILLDNNHFVIPLNMRNK